MQEKIAKAIEYYKRKADMTKILENRWIGMYLELVDFKTKNKHANVPVRYVKNRSLGYWIRRQRLVYHEGTMDLERESLLRLIGFNFRLLAIHDWDNMYKNLLEFKKKFGHVRVTGSYNDPQLHTWLIYQRKLYWKGKLHQDKIEKLKSIGVDMRNKTLNRWEERYEQLVKFKKEHGHLHICTSFGADKELISFVKVVRRSQETMSKARKEQLNDLGFDWNPHRTVTAILNRQRADNQWMERFEELKRFKKTFGTSYILTTSKPHKSLATWISVQRNKISKLSEEKLSLLNEIGFFEDNKMRISKLED